MFELARAVARQRGIHHRANAVGRRWDVKAVDECRRNDEPSYVPVTDALGQHGCYRHCRTDQDASSTYVHHSFFNVYGLVFSWKVQY